ncbi:MAG: hypothetical protein Fur0024_2670 [Patescibacteria group bacterium]
MIRRVEFSKKEKVKSEFNWRNFFYISLFVWFFAIGGFLYSVFQVWQDDKKTETKKINVKIISRKDWGANENLLFWDKDPEVNPRTDQLYFEFPEDLKIEKRILQIDGKNLKIAKEFAPKVKRIVIHHTGTNQDFTDPADVKIYLQKLLKFHTDPNGENFTGDLPYHYLIAPNGDIYEGIRGGDKVIASHTAGANTGSLGISVLGNFNTDEITDKALESLKNLIEQKAIEYDIDPRGTQKFLGNQIKNLSGHREYENYLVNGNKQITDCPGDHLFEKIDTLRKKTATSFEEKTEKKNKILFFAFLFVVSFGSMLYSREVTIRQKQMKKS